MLQAWRVGSSGSRLSGVTPGEHEGDTLHRESLAALHAEALTPNRTRWSTDLFSVTPKAKVLARAIADALLSGPIDKRRMVERLSALFGQSYRWASRLVIRIAAQFDPSRRPSRYALANFIFHDQGFRRALTRHDLKVQPSLAKPSMVPTAGPPTRWPVPPITTLGDLAALLNLNLNELRWFAGGWDQHQTKDPRLHHYRYHWITKRDGSARLIEIPKQRLKAIQRFLLRHILAHIPPHDAAHGFRKARSIRSVASPHTGQAIVLKLDLKDFFVCIKRPRITGIFLTAGYPEPVARALSALCTNRVPADVLAKAPRPSNPARSLYPYKQLYHSPHLPQGAPTSPALANLSAWRLDCRLAGLAHAAGATYTRYADDLLFSGGSGLVRSIQRFYIKACAIALEEGFEVNTRKTRIMKPSRRQHAAGLTLNQRLNISRRQFDQLKATLTNCIRSGPASQNRAAIPNFRAHLLGRIAHLQSVNPARGEKLKTLFEQIPW